jgi:ABC-2 type transport system permease protein
MLSLPLWRYVLTAVLRDRVIQIMLVLMVMGMSAALFLGNAAVIEKQEFAVATAATILRMLSVLGLVTFICFFVRRAFESREIDYLLATPLSRHKLLFSFSTAFITVAFILSLAMAMVLFVLARHYTEGWLIWSVSVFIELSITAMIALFFSIALKSATVSVLGSLGYYSLARMLGAMIGILVNKVGENTTVGHGISWIIKVISTITPRFDLLSQSAWLVYGDAAGVSLWMLPAQMIVFCSLFFFAAAFDLRRSQF